MNRKAFLLSALSVCAAALLAGCSDDTESTYDDGSSVSYYSSVSRSYDDDDDYSYSHRSYSSHSDYDDDYDYDYDSDFDDYDFDLHDGEVGDNDFDGDVDGNDFENEWSTFLDDKYEEFGY